MSIAEDIRLAYNEIGTAYTIGRTTGDISGEYADIIPNEQATKPFIRSFFKEFATRSNTALVAGDIVTIDITSEQFLVMNIDPDFFENEVIEKLGVFYKVNVSGELTRPSGEVWNSQTYQKETVWQTVKETAYALQTDAVFGETLFEEDFGYIQNDKDHLFIPSVYGIQVNDRFTPQSGEYYRVDSVLARRFAGSVDFCMLDEDNR